MEDLDAITEILRRRDGVATDVVLGDGRRFSVLNIAWGRDMGASCDHITTNISPGPPGASIGFFHTDEVESIIDPETQAAIFVR